jgi:AcrR family transcriptional regulator
MANVKRLDPRVVRTRQMLREALIALILHKGYDAISVQDITDQAGLRRATFYLHYRDKEELLFTILRGTFDDLVSQLEALPHSILTLEAARAIHLTIFRHAQQNADLYRTILSGQGTMVIVRYVREYLIARIRERFVAELPEADLPVPVEVLANYMASIMLNMTTWWLEKGMPYAPERMAELCTHLTLDGALGALKKQPSSDPGETAQTGLK